MVYLIALLLIIAVVIHWLWRYRIKTRFAIQSNFDAREMSLRASTQGKNRDSSLEKTHRVENPAASGDVLIVNKEMEITWKHHPEWKRFKKMETILRTIYESLDSTSISLSERRKMHLDDDIYTYGEIEFLSFLTLLDK